MLAATLCLLQSDLHDLFGDTGDLDVHLQRGDAVSRTCDLEVHVAEVVFVTEDVGENRETVAFEDEAHGDTGNRLGKRNACVHQRQRGAADRCHRRGAVGFGDFGNDAQRVGELFGGRQHRTDSAPCELAVADFTTARRAHAACFTDRVGREVVMQQEAFLVHAGEAVDILLVFAGAEGRNNDRLGFTAGEERRTVRARQNADFGNDRANGRQVAAVDAALGVENVPANNLGLKVLEDSADFFRRVLGFAFFRQEVRLHLSLDGVDGGVTGGLFGDLVSVAQFSFGECQHLVFESGKIFRFEFARFLGGNFGELDDRIDNRLETAVTEHDRAEHDVFVEFLGFRFHHQDGVLRAGNNQVQNRLIHLVEMRVQNIFAVDVANARAANRAHEGNAGKRERRGCGDHGEDVRIVFQVVLDNGDDNLGVVLVTFREERTDRAVDQARNERFVFARTAFTLEVTAGDLAGCVGLFLIVDRQREEILTRLRRLSGNHSRENHGLAVGCDDGAISLTGNLAGLELQRAACPFDFHGVLIEHILSLVVAARPVIVTGRGSAVTQSRARQREAWTGKHPAILPHDRSAVEKGGTGPSGSPLSPGGHICGKRPENHAA